MSKVKIFLDKIKNELLKYIPKTKERKKEKIISAVLGSIPWFGAMLSTVASIKSDEKFANMFEGILKRLDEHDKLFEIITDKISYSTLNDVQINELLFNEDHNTFEQESLKRLEHSDTYEKEKIEFGTGIWIIPWRDLCLSFLKYLQEKPGGQFLRFKEELIGTNFISTSVRFYLVLYILLMKRTTLFKPRWVTVFQSVLLG